LKAQIPWLRVFVEGVVIDGQWFNKVGHVVGIERVTGRRDFVEVRWRKVNR